MRKKTAAPEKFRPGTRIKVVKTTWRCPFGAKVGMVGSYLELWSTPYGNLHLVTLDELPDHPVDNPFTGKTGWAFEEGEIEEANCEKV